MDVQWQTALMMPSESLPLPLTPNSLSACVRLSAFMYYIFVLTQNDQPLVGSLLKLGMVFLKCIPFQYSGVSLKGKAFSYIISILLYSLYCVICYFINLFCPLPTTHKHLQCGERLNCDPTAVFHLYTVGQPML